ncbi:MAG TPA: hypothetical protein VJT75_17070 [Thermoleophilaceae bacterium]|nr:hypothetical protein [Thermoleophilaceae bacterium]
MHRSIVKVMRRGAATDASHAEVLARVRESSTRLTLGGNDAGDTVAVWRARTAVKIASSLAGQSFDKPLVLASGGAQPVLAAGPKRRFAVAWVARRGTRVRVAIGTTGSGFSRRATIPSRDPVALHLTFNRRGAVFLLVEEYADRAAAWLRPRGQDWRSAGTVPGSEVASGGTEAALRPDGSMVALLSGWRGETGVAATYGTRAKGWTKPRVLAPRGQFAVLGATADGEIAAVCNLYTRAGVPEGVATAVAAPDERLGRMDRLAGDDATRAAIDVSDRGARLATWEQGRNRDGTASLRYAAWRASGVRRMGSVQDGHVDEHDAAVADDGRALIVWTHGGSGRRAGLYFTVVR